MDPSSSSRHLREDAYSLSPKSRLRSSSSVSTTQDLLNGLQLVDSATFPAAASSSNTPSSQGLSDRLSASASPLFSTDPPVYLALPEEQASSDWFTVDSSSFQNQPPPLQRTPSSSYVSLTPRSLPQPTPASSSVDAATMSAVAALQFEPVFIMGSRSSYATWPVPENNPGLLSHGLPSYGSDTSLSPPTGSRSVTASPPRAPITLTAQQRELKRQRELARRESKVASRRQLESSASGVAGLGISGPVTSGTPSVSSTADSSDHSTSAAAVPIRTPSFTDGSSPSSFMQSPPVTMADLNAVSSAGTLPVVYTSSSTPHISLLAEPVTSTASAATSLAPSYSTYSASQGVFSSSYQQQATYLSEYSTASFPTTAPPTMPPQYGYVTERSPEPWRSSASSPRRNRLADQQAMVYQMPPQHIRPGPLQPSHQAQLPHLGQHASAMHSHHHSPQQQQGGLGGHGHGLVPHIQDSMMGAATGPSGVRVLQGRPKPQCWEHGCNGRQFSTFSNLLRHQREKSGQAAKAVCPNCGAEFTRTTARNGHLAHDKCKQRRSA